MGEPAPQPATGLADEFGEVTVEMLRATFDHWRIFEKDGRWWAIGAGTARLPSGTGYRPATRTATIRYRTSRSSPRTTAMSVVATYRTADSAYKGGGGREFVRRLALVQARVPLEAVGHPTAHVLGRRVAGKVLGGNPLPSVLRRLPARGPLGAPVAPRLPFGEALKHNLGLAHRLRPARAVADLVIPDRLQELAAVGGELVGASSP